jgi:hypothetical protein
MTEIVEAAQLGLRKEAESDNLPISAYGKRNYDCHSRIIHETSRRGEFGDIFPNSLSNLAYFY